MLQNAALTTTPSQQEQIGPAGVGGRMRFETNYVGGFFGPHSTVIAASAHFDPRAVSAYESGLRNWAPSLLGPQPEGAIGWQWQADLAEGGARASGVVSCTLNAWTPEMPDESFQYCADDSQGATQIVQSSFQMGLFVTPGGGFKSDSLSPGGIWTTTDALTDWPGPLSGTLLAITNGPNAGGEIVSVDITGHLDNEGRTCVYERVLLSGVFPPGPDPIVPRDLTTDERGIAYGHPYFLNGIGGSEVAWVFRPPVFRWIYESPPIVPPLRQYPRDDGRGLSSAKRIYPPPKAMQAGNRQHGGYW